MKDETGNISIIIPTFNRAHSLPDSILSILNQTCSNWELIIVDDGSTDDTFSEIKEFIEDDRIKYFFQNNQGVSAARNFGVEMATGDYLIFLDSDDIFSPDLIENLYDARFWKYDLIFWEVLKRIDAKYSLWIPVKLGNMYNNIKASFLAGSVCYRKRVFIEAGCYDPKMTSGENYELGLRVSQIESLEIKYIDRPLLKYAITTDNRMNDTLSNRLFSQIYLYRKHKKKYDSNPKEKTLINYIIGFSLERSGKKSAALKRYKVSWCIAPWYLKPLLKIIYLKIF